jgi:hypothetical protein
MVIQPQLIHFLNEKATKERGDMALLHSSTYIRQLIDHINGKCKLTNHEVEVRINYLAGCLTITLDNPITGLEFLRARICEDNRFNNIDDLSYIQTTTESFPKAGRLNKRGQAVFYASVAVKQDDSALQAVFSETGAERHDQLNVLRSHQTTKSELNLRLIGIWDQVRRDEKPYYLNSDIFEYYKKVREYMVQRFEPKLLSAYELTDRFLADILSREGNKALYQVTSELGSIFLSGKSDGIIYSSVEARGEPVVALHPSAVDDKLVHQFVCDILIQENYGYDFFLYKNRGMTSSIDSATGKLNWYPIKH